MAKKKIAVLGGGVGAMAAAYALTSVPGAAEKYEVTVYQMGWRLGGKGASGRNPAIAQRIEEHGLHVWSGFYDNAIRVMKEMLGELNGTPGVYHSFDEAFIPHNNIALGDRVNGEWKPWVLEPPMNDADPGSDGVTLSPFEYFQMLVKFLTEVAETQAKAGGRGAGDLQRLNAHVAAMPKDAANHDPQDMVRLGAHLGRSFVEMADDRDIARTILTDEEGLEADLDDDLRRAGIMLDLGFAVMRGMLENDVFRQGFDVIDDEEITPFLKRYGASDTSLDSGLIRAIYDYAFGFMHGRTTDENRAIGAGTFIRGCFRLFFTYKGAIFYKMRAGMGDTIFTPFYRILEQRGVKFEFFHKVTALGLDARKSAIETISMDRQVTLKSGSYDPFVRVGDLDCWPSDPLYDQIVEGEALKTRGINLESWWSDWEPKARRDLVRGQDFDEVILGISLGALPYLCKDLADNDPRWKRMFDKVKTDSTQSFQLWFKDSVEDLGWPHGDSILTAYADDLNTWADMTHLDPTEDWPEDNKPGSIAYFCGPLADPDVIPPFTDHGYPARVKAEVVARCRDWMEKEGAFLFPKAYDAKGKFKPSSLCVPKGTKAADAWDAQYFRGNIDPNERYVLSAPGSTSARLRADESGFDNLWLAGDWTYTGINAGCVEAATMSGLRAAEGLTGVDMKIVGENEVPGAMPKSKPVYPTLTTLRPQNTKFPWSGAYGMAQTTGPTVMLGRPRAEVEKLLPEGLELAPQDLTGPDQHPIILLFGRQRDVRPNLLPIGMDYLEFICAVPYVRHTDPALQDMPPLITPTRLYLNALPPILLGVYGYGFPKLRARMSSDASCYEVCDPRDGSPIISCEFKFSGPQARAEDYEPMARVRPAYEMAMVNKNKLGMWQYAYYDFSLGQALVQPLDMEIKVYSDCFGLEPCVLKPPSVKDSPLGGFFLTSAATINNPLQSFELRDTLRKIKS
ncbi:NAD(P)-binding protein [Oceanomicrobium pacificus]|uniref:NAD(P)-binding protein n=1 Tax=Oceanomicrobium pacificus TaxID=2692916 RepID=A0A6B0TYC2_9RHOB|nr:NAD(P)-binding protein [Oceanomicrobium pacificus]MXU63911.1 NAD(P)-binding protein [Oceanomicrobium pacificus]